MRIPYDSEPVRCGSRTGSGAVRAVLRVVWPSRAVGAPAQVARTLIERNGFGAAGANPRIQVVTGKLEDLPSLPFDQARSPEHPRARFDQAQSPSNLGLGSIPRAPPSHLTPRAPRPA